jgi:precorrin-2 dehydrogenase/sirohydrochlorin ferrochelatase
LLIDIRLKGKTAALFGGGRTAERKVRTLLEHGARIKVISKGFTEGLRDLGRNDEIELIEADLDETSPIIPDQISSAAIVIAATDSPEINTVISQAARDEDVLVCAVDMPAVSDFYFPAIAQKGNIRVGVCTDGKSPLMSKLIKERIQTALTNEDALSVDLQAYARSIAKTRIPGSGNRRTALYKIAQDPDIQKSLATGDLQGAMLRAREILEAFLESAGESSKSKGG